MGTVVVEFLQGRSPKRVGVVDDQGSSTPGVYLQAGRCRCTGEGPIHRLGDFIAFFCFMILLFFAVFVVSMASRALDKTGR